MFQANVFSFLTVLAEQSEANPSNLQLPIWCRNYTLCANLFWAEIERMNQSRHRLASLGNPKKKKSSLLFLIFAGVIFSKMERTFFFFGFCPRSFWAGGGTNADEVLAKLFFGERVCQNFGSLVFEFWSRKWKRRGFGEEFSICSSFCFGEIRGGLFSLHLLFAIDPLLPTPNRS